MNQINRRDFQRYALSGAAGLAAWQFSGIARAEQTPLRVAVIGHTGRGNFGHAIDTMWQHLPGTKLVAVADANEAGLSAARKRFPDAAAFADYHKMLAETEPDLVAVGPRFTDQHLEMCLAGIESGARGVYVEKPFCQTPAQADEIVAAADEHTVKLAVAHRNRYHPTLPVVKQLVEDGEIGQLLEVRARGKEDSRGGCQDTWVLGSHIFNAAAFLVGQPRTVSGRLYQDDRPCTAADIRDGAEGIGPIAGNRLHARFEMENGRPLYFDSIQNHGDPQTGFGFQLIGTKGVIDLRMDQVTLAHIRRGHPFNPAASSGPWIPITSQGIDQPETESKLSFRNVYHLDAAGDLLAAIAEDRAPLCDAKAGRTTVEMICGIFASHMQNGAEVSFPLEDRTHPLAQG
ncbi:Gfo/Idh/MocA family oxidoreductase [bacterium]|nr:Gfo/Idh/MocA family oxidoreductase [bacterium]